MTKYQLVQQSTVHLHTDKNCSIALDRDQMIAEVNKIYSEMGLSGLFDMRYCRFETELTLCHVTLVTLVTA